MQTSLRVLHLEDDPYDAELAQELLLSEGIPCEVVRIDNRVDFASALEERAFDLILADNSLPGFDGLSALALASQKAPDIPFIFVSGTLGEEVAIESLKSGATDYVLKQRMARLVPVVRRAVQDAEEHKKRLRAEEEARRRLAELEAVNRISTAMRTAPTPDEMILHLMDEMLAVLNTDAGTIWLYEADKRQLRQGIARGWFTQLGEMPIKPGEGIAGTVFASNEAYVSREFARDPLTRQSVHSQIPAGWGGACVPIRTAHELVGVLFVSVPLPRTFTPEETRLLITLAEIAGNAIHRSRLHEQTEVRLQHLIALRAIDVAISNSFDLRVTLDVILDKVTSQLHVDAAGILLLHPNLQILVYAAGRGFRTPEVERSRIHLGEGQVGLAALEHRTIGVPDLTRESREDFANILSRKSLFAAERFAAYFTVPLVVKGQVKGVMEIFHRAPLDPDPEWLEFLETLAGQAAIAIENAQLFEGLRRSNLELTLAYNSTIEGWSRALDLRDRETEGHTRRVTELTLKLARAMEIGEEELVHIRRGALLHDIGKMGVPDGILLKPGPLTEGEWTIMRRHPVYAYEMLSPIAYLLPALDIPYCHHEKWSGRGYPRGLKGEEIPLPARIFAVVDVWDALCSDRPYRMAWSESKVRAYIQKQSGKYFDPQVVEKFLTLV